MARLNFKPNIWEELVKVLPDCEAKRMMIFYNKFIEVRKLYKARQVTLEQRQRLSVLADKMETYVLTSLKFITYTSHFHGITQHMPGYFTELATFLPLQWFLGSLQQDPEVFNPLQDLPR